LVGLARRDASKFKAQFACGKALAAELIVLL
jgi:hypothetical protein